MRVQKQFMKPYAKLEEGIISDAIITYGQRPYSRVANPNKGYDYVDEWQKILIMDLWLIKLRVTWFKKGQLPEEAKA
jgi:hypothetical protein